MNVRPVGEPHRCRRRPGAKGLPVSRRGPVIVLTGPTGTGKTEWAIRLAEQLPVEIVSVDSALVYRGLDIGTAKPSRELREHTPHHLIDICEPSESYSAGRFVQDAVSLVDEIQSARTHSAPGRRHHAVLARAVAGHRTVADRLAAVA